MAFIVPILTAVGSVAGTVMQAGQQQAAAQASANASYYNAAIAQNNANAAMQAARVEKLQQDRKNRAQLESVRSKYLGSGIELEGTPLLVLQEENSQMALDSERILEQGRNRAANYQNQANLHSYQAATALSAASAQSSGTLIGGILGTASQVGRSIFSGA